MSNDPKALQQAADDLRTLGRRFEGLFRVADVIESIGSIENAANEAVARRDKLMADLDEVEKRHADRLAELNAEYAGLRARQDTELLSQRTAANEQLQNTQNEAKKLLGDATTEAAAAIRDAKVEASRIYGSAEQRVNEANERVKELELQEQDLAQRIANMSNEANALQQRLDDIRARIKTAETL